MVLRVLFLIKILRQILIRHGLFKQVCSPFHHNRATRVCTEHTRLALITNIYFFCILEIKSSLIVIQIRLNILMSFDKYVFEFSKKITTISRFKFKWKLIATTRAHKLEAQFFGIWEILICFSILLLTDILAIISGVPGNVCILASF